MVKIIPAPTPEDALQRVLGIESLGDAMDAVLDMFPMSNADFAKMNNALVKKHFGNEDDITLYYECVRRDVNFAGPEETPCIVCGSCLEEVPVSQDDHEESEYVLLSHEPLPFEGLECEVCGQ